MRRELDHRVLSGQRWFAGKHRELEHVLDGGEVPLVGGALRLAEARYADGGQPELYLLPDPGIDWPRSLRKLAEAGITGDAGTLRLRLAPGAETLPLAGPGTVSVPSLDQSNTLLAVDEKLLIKLYRLLRAGVHPEIEVGEALVGTDAPVARHHGALELETPDGAVTVIGCLQEFIPGAQGGWEWPIRVAVSDLSAGGVSESTLELARDCGLALARLHAALADSLGVSEPGERYTTEYRVAKATLDELVDAGEISRQTWGGLGHWLRPLWSSETPAQRIHGDLHIGQFLRCGDQLTVIDFEGNPTLPLKARREPSSPLRDLATLRCSFDHVATAAARRVDSPMSATTDWSDRVLAAVSDGYRSAAGAVEVSAGELFAFEVAAELRELQYARSVLPEWAYVARAGIRRLSGRDRPSPPIQAVKGQLGGRSDQGSPERG